MVCGVIAASLVGCTATPPAGQTPSTTSQTTTGAASGPGQRNIDWAGRICEVAAKELPVFRAEPRVDWTTTDTARSDLVAYLDGLAKAARRMVDGWTAAGSPELPDGDLIAMNIVGNMDVAADLLEQARDEIAAAKGQAALEAALADVEEDLSRIGNLDPGAFVADHPLAVEAFNTARPCRDLAKARS
ncbi:hypothetical protein GCM10023148_32190 [Actinokineospora soli]